MDPLGYLQITHLEPFLGTEASKAEGSLLDRHVRLSNLLFHPSLTPL
jgi:hypothetical protein